MTQILVIEDEVSVLEIIEEILAAEGFDVLTAKNGQIGLEIARDRFPDLILCDIQMPVLDGYSVLKTLHEDPQTTTIPFIFLSAKSSRSSQREGMDLGADDYIPKPFTRDELLSAIRGRLDRHKKLENHSSQQLDQLRRNLTVALPHELRTPLQGIITSAELLGEYWENLDRDEIQEITGNIRVSANRLHELIQKFLLYTKLDLAAHEPEEFNKWYVSATGTSELLLGSLGEQIAGQYDRKDDLQMSFCPAYIMVSEKWLSTLAKELIDNAFKFSQPSSPHSLRDTSVNLLSEIIGDRWQLRISDHGRGMTQEQIRSIGAYMQFDRQQYEQQGSGLGLAIADRIVKIYNGTMVIDSTVGLGTTITISFPTQTMDEILDQSLLQ